MSALPTLHVVVSCKSRKTLAVPSKLRMSSVRVKALGARVQDWTTRLQESASRRVPASQLYAGDHWKVVLRIPNATEGQLDVQVWVISAGYGLVALDTPLKPYSATFIRSHSESVTPPGSDFAATAWWRTMAQWRPESYTHSRTLVDLAGRVADERGVMLLALSAPYALALRDDVAAAEQCLPDKIGLVSVGLANASAADLPASHLPVSARLKLTVGGAMQGVNSRIAEMIVREHAHWYPSIKRLRHLVLDWVSAAPELPRYDRTLQTDEEVRHFVRDRVQVGGRCSRTALLRALRDSGRSCEQDRFNRLYRDVIGECESSIAENSSGMAGDAA